MSSVILGSQDTNAPPADAEAAFAEAVDGNKKLCQALCTVFDSRFTDETDVKALLEQLEPRLKERYANGCVFFAAGQLERCPDTQRLHLHFIAHIANVSKSNNTGFTIVNLRNAWTPGLFENINVKKIWNWDGAKAYVTKTETRVSAEPVSVGSDKFTGRGKRRDLTEDAEFLTELARKHARYEFMRVVAHDRPDLLLKHGANVGLVFDAATSNAPHDKLEHVWLYVGEPGAGKTYSMNQLGNVYKGITKKNNNTYWEGYNFQEWVCIDEMNGSFFTYTEFKRLVDPGKLNVEQHGDTRSHRYTVNSSAAGSAKPFGSKGIVFGSNMLPTDWYDNKKEGGVASMARRFTKVIWFYGDYEAGTAGKKEFTTRAEILDLFKWMDRQKDAEGNPLPSDIVYDNFKSKYTTQRTVNDALRFV